MHLLVRAQQYWVCVTVFAMTSLDLVHVAITMLQLVVSNLESGLISQTGQHHHSAGACLPVRLRYSSCAASHHTKNASWVMLIWAGTASSFFMTRAVRSGFIPT